MVPGTLMVLILRNESRGHIAVSLGAFDRQEGEYDPAENPQGVLQTTMEYVTGLLEQRYGVGQDLLLGLNSITQYPNTWMEKKYLGTDILLDDDTRKYISTDDKNQYLIIGRNPKNLFTTSDNLFELISEKKGEQTEFRLKKYL